MEFKDYLEFTNTTAVYPKHTELQYLKYASFAEVGEVAGVYAKYVRGDFDSRELQNRLIKELGDIIWMLTRYCNALLEVIPDAEQYDRDLLYISSLFEETNIGRHNNRYGTVITISLCLKFLETNLHGLDLLFKDTLIHLMNTPNFRQSFFDSITDINRTIVEILLISIPGVTLNQVIETNYQKLKSRLESNTIKGDGDNR